MVAYEYYWRDAIKGYELVGILPERRKYLKRITQESIIRLGKKFLGDNADVGNIFFIRIAIEKTTGEISRPKPSLGLS